MDFLTQLGEVVNGPKAIVLSGLTFAIVDALKPVLRLQGGRVKWFALAVAVFLCFLDLYFRAAPMPVGRPLVKEIITMAFTAFFAVFVFAKSREVAREKTGRGAPANVDSTEEK